jgi:hypothetical protein
MASAVFFIVLTIGLLLVSSFVLLQQKQTEGFENNYYSVKDIEINACPTFSSEIQTSKGSTDCCQGDMVDGKCNGKTFCTKSPAYPGVPSCVDAWREIFAKKSLEFCPPTMKNYYENVRDPGGVKGCSSSPITKNGAQPKDSLQPRCVVYSSESMNRGTANSCYLEKERAKIQCPVVNGKSPAARASFLGGKPVFFCEYPFELGMPDKCYDKVTFEGILNESYPNWRTDKGYSDAIHRLVCSNFIATRAMARDDANRLQAEEKARAATEVARKAAEDARMKAEELAKKKTEEASRLQQQLDEANRQLRTCKK